ncbi:MAG TPA: hypothetical protein VI383_01300 [Gemmatimonadales bacterium]|nr:hypothetical protein [Gemmatimonadales bacterium]
MTRLNWVLGLAAAGAALAGCSGDEPTDPLFRITVYMRNQDPAQQNIHIYIEAVGQSLDGTTITPGSFRTVELRASEYQNGVKFTAGRTVTPVITQKTCTRASENKNPEVIWNGAALSCVGW